MRVVTFHTWAVAGLGCALIAIGFQNRRNLVLFSQLGCLQGEVEELGMGGCGLFL